MDDINEISVTNLQIKVRTCLAVVNLYREILDSYVLDFYVHSVWNRLPSSWKDLENFSLESFSSFLISNQDNISNNNVSKNKVFPLSLLALKSLTFSICVPRAKKSNMSVQKSDSKSLPLKLEREIKRRVKPKKLHEIENLKEICSRIYSKSDRSLVIDFGSGLGHLSRFLSLNCNVDVCCIEQQSKFVKEAKRLDQLIQEKYKRIIGEELKSKITHITQKLTTPQDFEHVLNQIKDHNWNEITSVGLLGLHPCGDLAVLLLRSFLQNAPITCINIASCCYMKLTTATTLDKNQPKEPATSSKKIKHFISYPLSQFVQNQSGFELSYQMLEVACHANEKYGERLQAADFNFLKVHSYRAALEAIIVAYRPDLKHSGLRSVQHSDSLSFKEYCCQATKVGGRLEFTVPREDIDSEKTVTMLNQWKRVVIFYILRLILAPFVESIILYDRVLYLKEHGCEASLIPAFDPIISPRCHILQAIKQKTAINECFLKQFH